MKIYGPSIAEGSEVTNLTMPIRTDFPTSPNAGELVYREDLQAAYVHNGTDWSVVYNSDTISDIDANGSKWVGKTGVPDSGWMGVTYGDGLYVAVAQNTTNNIMYSNDGTKWNLLSSPVANGLWSVAYGNGLFAAIAASGTSNHVITSPDGINWTAQTTPTNTQWFSVTYGNGTFVAVGATDPTNIMYSYNGVDWTAIAAPVANTWFSVCYGNGLFVAVSITGTGNRVMTSPDGVNWTIRTSAADLNWNSVCYGNGLFVAVASSGTGTRVMTSPDGIAWTLRNSAADIGWQTVCYGNGHFVALASSGVGGRVMTSPNGIDWSLKSAAADLQWTSVCYGNGQFMAVATSGTGNRVMTSGAPEVLPVMLANVYHGPFTFTSDVSIEGSLTVSGSVAVDEISNGTSSVSIPVTNGDVIVTTAGNERVRVDASGNVGIGTSTALVPLDIRAPQALLDLNAGSDPLTNVNILNPSSDINTGPTIAFSSYYNGGSRVPLATLAVERNIGEGSGSNAASNSIIIRQAQLTSPSLIERVRISPSGAIATGGETAPDVDAGGICINTGTNDGISLSLKNSDVSHPFTTRAQADTYAFARKGESTTGGLWFGGLSTTSFGIVMEASCTTPSTNSTTAGALRLVSRKSDGGTGGQILADNENVLSVENNYTVVSVIKGNGDHYLAGRIVTGGETTPDVDFGGICINHGVSDGRAFSVKNTDVTHPFTSIAETDTYLTIRKADNNNGGAALYGFAESTNPGVLLRGYSQTGVTSLSGNAPLTLVGGKSDGATGVTTLASNENVLGVWNNSSNVLQVKGNGDTIISGGLTSAGTETITTAANVPAQQINGTYRYVWGALKPASTNVTITLTAPSYLMGKLVFLYSHYNAATTQGAFAEGYFSANSTVVAWNETASNNLTTTGAGNITFTTNDTNKTLTVEIPAGDAAHGEFSIIFESTHALTNLTIA